MDRFLAISVFAKVVEQGSFARAAARLELSTSAVSRHVAELEAHLDARLLNRTTRRLSLTESGAAFYERCVQLLADLEEAEEAVTSATVVPRGTLKLTCSITFGVRHLAPAIAAFAARHPQTALRRRALGPRGRHRRRRIRPRGPHRRHRQPEPDRATHRHDAARLLCGAGVLCAPWRRRMTPADLAQHACLSVRVLAGAQRLALPRPERATIMTFALPGPVHANNGQMLTAPSRPRASGSRSSRTSSSPRTCAPGRCVPLLRGLSAAADPHPRRLSEPAPSVGEGSRVRRLPVRAL